METLKYTPIKSVEQYYEYCRICEELDFGPESESHEDEIELLCILVNDYDENHSTLTTHEPKTVQDIVKHYALGLKLRDLKHLYTLLHPQFNFTYPLGDDMGHGIQTDIRYIGHMFKTLIAMKMEGREIKTGFCHVEVGNVKNLSIKLYPPHDRRIIYPMDNQLPEELRKPLPNGDVLLYTRTKDFLLRKVECYTNKRDFDRKVGGKVDEINWGS